MVVSAIFRSNFEAGRIIVSSRTSFSHLTFRDMMHRARQEAILEECSRLMGVLGYEAMTLDQVAEAAGVAKAVLYKHFKGKEDMCCAVMVRAFEEMIQYFDTFPARMPAVQRIEMYLRWLFRKMLHNQTPMSIERRSEIRHALDHSQPYLQCRATLSERLSSWIEDAQMQGDIPRHVPVPVTTQFLMSRVSEPMLDAMLVTGTYTMSEVEEWCVALNMTILRVGPSQPAVATPPRAAVHEALQPPALAPQAQHGRRRTANAL